MNEFKSKRDNLDYKNVALCLDGVGSRSYIPITMLRYLLSQIGNSDFNSIFDVVSANDMCLVIAMALISRQNSKRILGFEDSL